MLHERSLPDEVAQDLNRVYQIKLRLLDWLLRSPPMELETEELLTDHFGELLGNWFWVRIRRPETRTQFGTAVLALAAKARNETLEALAVSEAISHDAQFHAQWDIDGFELQFPRLHAGWLTVVRNVAEPFYDWLAGDGFDATIFGLVGGAMDRIRVMSAFRPQSSGICGYCDGPLGEVGSTKEANDCDHFFPKSHWPHLAIHPSNLFAACKGCNSTWKGAQSPMGDADVQGLSGTYHPMLRPGVSKILVAAVVSHMSPRMVDITITDQVVPRRAETLVQTLDLAARWTSWANEKLDQGVSVFVAHAVHHRRRGGQPDADLLREVIADDIAWYRDQIGKGEHCLRQIAVLERQRETMLHEIIAEFA